MGGFEVWRAMAVHGFTALGAAAGLLALEAAFAADFSACFAWLAVALVIDGVDGALARAVKVKTHAAFIDGDVLDLVVDFLTYVVVPAVVLLKAGLMPDWLARTLALAVVTASALYFADTRMKTPDHWFRGFPAIWNVAVFYLVVFAPPAWLTALLVLGGIVAMFAPIVFVHPMRVARLRSVTMTVLAVWAACAAVVIAKDFEGVTLARAGLALSAAYFLLLPLARRRL
jgi:phosphatidylcholine synthase